MKINHIIQYFKPYNWYLFTKSKLRKLLTPKDVLKFYNYLSLRSALCSDCVLKGKCSECGCATPDIFYEGKRCEKYKEYLKLKNEH